MPKAFTDPRNRRYYNRLQEIMDIPNLMEIQKKSYNDFIQKSILPENRKNQGLQAVFQSVFPIYDFNNNSSLEFAGFTFGDPKYSVEECRERDMTFSAPLKVTLRLVVRETDLDSKAKRIKDIKEQEVFFCELPLMTMKGTFIINGAERVIVSQLHRSPGVSFDEDESKASHLGKRLMTGRIIPYYTRREIDIEGVLKGKGLELIWVSDPAELNSLHTQGSGKIKLEDGTLLTVGYAKNNGWPYRSVTQNLLDRNKIEKGNASYRNFKVWLKGKSDGERDEILSYNERYIFFRFLDRDPIGALGEPVTPGRSIATDPDYFPKGALAFIRLRKPILDADGRPSRRVPFSRFVLLQDKGSAIKGPGRVDLFCGFGPDAQATAGTLKENGELYVLIPR